MPQCRSLSAVLIDLDGTLMDTIPDLAEAANRMRLELGLPALPVERIGMFVGKGADVLVHRALTDDLEGRVDEGRLAEGRVVFYRAYHAVNGQRAQVFDGVPEALDLLAEAGLVLACVTNKPREFTLPLLARVGIGGAFATVVAGDDAPEPKPHPGALLKACEGLRVPPGSALMLGDSINDLLAARAAGMGAVLVETGYNEGASLETLKGQPGLEALFPTLLEAARWIIARP